MACIHSIQAGAFLLVAGAIAGSAAAQPAPSSPSRATFTIFIGSAAVGTEETSVERTAEGWTINSSGRIGPPLDIVTRRLQIKYDPDWKPLELTIDASARDRPAPLHTTVSGTTAKNEFSSIGGPTEKTDTIDAAAVLLPNPFFAAYEALAARLQTAAEGSTIALYQAPVTSLTATVGESSEERIQTVTRLVQVKRTRVTFGAEGAPPVIADIWGDQNGRLLRIHVPAQNLDVVRDDIAAVSSRRVAITRAGDEQVRMPANGFVLTGTISKPADTGTRRLPAVVLVGGSGPTDRDETLFGIPIFGQLAGLLADAGYIVLRYDKRGVGQSGGRPESATLADYTEDLRAAIKFLGDRKDVDNKKIAVVGHSEGGAVSMLAAAKDNRIAALALLSSIGSTGAELNLAQVNHALERSTRSDAEKQSTLSLQKQIQTAVLTGKGWEAVPAGLRKQADIPWFQSFLSFDPAKPMADIRQPILIVQGLLDTQVAPANADRLEQLARARKKGGPVEVAKIPNVNHLLVPATTGEADEYASLSEQSVSPAVADAIVGWLGKTLADAK
jgi:pimeloyl-ACP methyl ester carboxylesterase